MQATLRPTFVLLLAAVALMSFISMIDAACQKVVTRKEFRDMTSTERTKWLNAVTKLFKSQQWNDFSKLHVTYAIYGHNTPALLPWHRQLLMNYQAALNKIDPDVVIPYWDSSLDSQAPASSVVWDYIGSSSGGGCVPDGPFANFKLSYPNNACLKRDFNPSGQGMSTLVTSEALGTLVRTETDYASFESKIEYGMHAVVHNAVGGDMAYMYSPNDPVFYLHHGFVDKLWSDWQSLHGQNTYNGVHNGAKVSINDNMVPFNVKVSGVTDHEEDLCYVYAQPSSGGASAITTSSSVASSTSTRGVTTSVTMAPSSSMSATRSSSSVAATSTPMSSSTQSMSTSSAILSSSASSWASSWSSSAMITSSSSAAVHSGTVSSAMPTSTTVAGTAILSSSTPVSSATMTSAPVSSATSSVSASATTTATSASSNGVSSTKTATSALATPTGGYTYQDFCDAFKNLQSSHYGSKNSSNAGVSFGTVSIVVSGQKYNSTLTLPIPPAPLPKSFLDRMMYNTTAVRAYENLQIQVMADIALSIRSGSYIAGPGASNTTNPGVPGHGTGSSAYGGLFKVYPPSNSSSVLSNYTTSPKAYNFTNADAAASVSGLVSSGASAMITFGASTILVVALSTFFMV